MEFAGLHIHRGGGVSVIVIGEDAAHLAPPVPDRHRVGAVVQK